MTLLDLSHPLHETTPAYPGDKPFSLTPVTTLAEDGYTGYYLQTQLHAGTHVDAPMHLWPDPRPIGNLPLEQFAGDGLLLDVRGLAEVPLSPSYDHLPLEGRIVLFYTDHEAFYGQPRYYSEPPTLTPALAEYLVRRQVKLVGIDAPSPDRPPFPVHKTLFAAGIPLLENAANLASLLFVPHFEVYAFPLRLAAEASLVRLVARIP